MTTIIHHSADFDGHASGHSVRVLLGKKQHEVKMIGWDHGQDVDFLEELINKDEGEIYITDISFPAEYMLRLKEIGAVWIDHHITAIKDSAANGYDDMKGLRQDGTAACRLVWDYFYKPQPESILLLGLYDVFNKSTRDWEKETLSFQYGLRGMKNIDWDAIFNLDLKGVYDIQAVGGGILQYQRLANFEEKGKCFDILIDGKRLIGKNANSGSAHFDWMTEAETKDYEGMMRFQFEPKNKLFSCSCYGWEHSPDLSVIAKKYGGGGHAHACGFTLTMEELNALIGP